MCRWAEYLVEGVGEQHPLGPESKFRLACLGKAFASDWCQLAELQRKLPTQNVGAAFGQTALDALLDPLLHSLLNALAQPFIQHSVAMVFSSWG